MSSAACAEDFFTSCRFHFGTEMSKVYDMDNKTTLNADIINEIDYFTGPWAGSAATYNIGNFFIGCKTLGKTPVVVGYVIAFAAYRDQGIQDCNATGTTLNLCVKGANYIRNNKSSILAVYDNFAKGIAQDYGTDKPVIWCMEPDYSQYTESTQEGGGLSTSEAASFMASILSTVKTSLPKSLFSMDISPWKDTTWQNTWFTTLEVDKNFTFINTSGGMSKAASSYISDDWATNLPTWAWVQKRWAKPMLADAGYSVSGSSTGHDSNWDNVTNLNNRIKEGVLGVAQYNPKSDWATTIKSIRSQLITPPECPGSTDIIDQKHTPVYHSTWNDNQNGVYELVDISGRVVCRMAATGMLSISSLVSRAGPGVYLVRNTDGQVAKTIVVER